MVRYVFLHVDFLISLSVNLHPLGLRMSRLGGVEEGFLEKRKQIRQRRRLSLFVHVKLESDKSQ